MTARMATYATSRTFAKALYKAGTPNDIAVSADWTPASGDVKVSIDGAASANITTLPTAVAMGGLAYWRFTLSNAELTGKEIVVVVDDAAIADDGFVVETVGHVSAMWPNVTVDSNIVSMAANTVTASALATDAVTEIVDAAVVGLGFQTYGTLASATSTTAVLHAGASGVDGAFTGSAILITSGLGEGQIRMITGYVGASKTATVAAWTTTPTGSSTYAIVNG